MATTRVTEDAGRFGVVEMDNGGGRVVGFEYKPDSPKTDVVTMEVFAYRPSALLGTLEELAEGGDGLSDFGADCSRGSCPPAGPSSTASTATGRTSARPRPTGRRTRTCSRVERAGWPGLHGLNTGAASTSTTRRGRSDDGGPSTAGPDRRLGVGRSRPGLARVPGGGTRRSVGPVARCRRGGGRPGRGRRAPAQRRRAVGRPRAAGHRGHGRRGGNRCHRGGRGEDRSSQRRVVAVCEHLFD